MSGLKLYQSLWAMELRRPDGFEHTDAERFRMIKDAGFHGVCLDPAAHEIEDCLAKKPLFEAHGLECMINAFPSNDADMRALLQLSKDMDATTFSIIGTVYPETVKEAVLIVRRWLDIAAEMDVPVLFETHRDCLTNDMFFTLELMEAIPEMRLCADFSHYVVGRELALPLSPQMQRLFTKLIERSDCFQGRVASREQIQVPLGFPQHAEWVELFKGWWAESFRSWRQRHRETQTDDKTDLIFLCELGPPHYAITDKDGYELSDRWEEALQIKSWVEDIWAITENL